MLMPYGCVRGYLHVSDSAFELPYDSVHDRNVNQKKIEKYLKPSEAANATYPILKSSPLRSFYMGNQFALACAGLQPIT
jgi:hypothetical protein